MFKPYKYIKEEVSEAEGGSEIVIRLPKPKLPTINVRRWASTLLIIFGLFLITDQILLPLLTTPPPQKPPLKPIAPQVLAVHKNLRPQEFVNFAFEELKPQEVDREEVSEDIPEVFYLTIPKLGIERAEVGTNSESLSPDERLGHYPGSALPGEVGNTFIYGHSVLPMFFDPKNYRTIFSTLDKLEEGDEIVVEFGERSFMYVIEKSVVLNPEDVHPLEPVTPSFLKKSYLTLMTCVPPGIRTKRLLVQARLVL